MTAPPDLLIRHAPKLLQLALKRGLKPPLAACVISPDGAVRMFMLGADGELGEALSEADSKMKVAGPMAVMLLDRYWHALSVRVTADGEVIGGPPVIQAA